MVPDPTPARVHEPVMVAEVMELLNPTPGDFTVETMVGAGGHSAEFLRRTSPDGRLLGIDRDPAILEVARGALASQASRISLCEACSDALREVLIQQAAPSPNIIFMDLGVSSLQLDEPGRGFSMMREGPLDMRMSARGETAAELLHRIDADALEHILRDYGDEPFARRIARELTDARRHRKFTTTTELAEFVKGLVPPRLRGRSRVHPATRVFQALRIAVNDELRVLERTLAQAFDALADGGRIGIISFHSGEDRIVKNFFRTLNRERRARTLTKKPLVASEAECARNPRSRSAKFRAALKGDFRRVDAARWSDESEDTA